jgi:acyl-CoA synthetase (AMP-forming)/AMP-acid ligase II
MNVSMHEWLEEAVSTTGDWKICESYDEEGAAVAHTASQLITKSKTLASSFLSAGIRYGDTVCIFMPRGFEFLTVFFAASRIGASIVACSVDSDRLDLDMEKKRTLDVFNILKPAFIICTEESRSYVESIMPIITAQTKLLLYSELHSLLSFSSVSAIDVQDESAVCGDTIIAYCFTGGSTGYSKCSVITQSMVVYELENYPSIAPGAMLRSTTEHPPRVLQQSSPYWSAAFLGQIDLALGLRGTIVFSKASAGSILQEVSLRKINVFGIVPSCLAVEVGNKDLASVLSSDVKLVICWGEAASPDLLKKIRIFDKVTNHRRTAFVDLLLSTEYWLSFYSDMTNATSGEKIKYKTLPGVKVSIRCRHNQFFRFIWRM